MPDGELTGQETYADWIDLKDGEGRVFRVDRYSKITIGPDAVERIEIMVAGLDPQTAPQQVALLMLIRACVKRIQELEAAQLPTEGSTS